MTVINASTADQDAKNGREDLIQLVEMLNNDDKLTFEMVLILQRLSLYNLMAGRLIDRCKTTAIIRSNVVVIKAMHEAGFKFNGLDFIMMADRGRSDCLAFFRTRDPWLKANGY